MDRLATLHKLAVGTNFDVLVTSFDVVTTKTLPLSSLQRHIEIIEHGGRVQRDDLIQKLMLCGYNRVDSVEDLGTFAVRGSIVDVFWPGLKNPVRIDLFGDDVERLYTFDPQTQRTLQNIKEFQFGPVKEIQLSDDIIESACHRLRHLADELDYPTAKLREKLHDLEHHIPFFGIENLLPAFHDKLESPLELIIHVYGKNKLTILHSPHTFAALAYNTEYEAALVRGDLCFPPTEFCLTDPQLKELFDTQSLIELEDVSSSPFSTLMTDTQHLLDPLVSRIKQLRQDHFTVLLPVSSLGGAHRLRELLSPHGLQVRSLDVIPDWMGSFSLENPSVHAYTFVAKPDTPAQGGILDKARLAVIAEDEIFGKRSRRTGGPGKKGRFRTSLADLEEGDPIVHVDHGVGIFKGLTRLAVRGVEQDYLLLMYAGDDKLYLPVHHINLVQTYSGAEGESPRLDKLGGSTWQSKKTKVKESVIAMAQDLLNLYAKRELMKRPHFLAPGPDYWDFEGRFPFETTPDQQKAIDDILDDLQKERPMDRLVCGDVGYGKTEVAMRAAMLTALSSRQVAVLAPTTILAQQHALSFEQRFKDSGINIGIVSRFQKAAEIKETLKKCSEGKIDILIGTHRILSIDVHFKNLGLVIVDEEQRFGIKHKEHLKKLRTQTDILTLSATPIPRTLQMGFFGLRDLSVIETPPVDRRAIRTSIAQFDDEVIREAIVRELARGGQVYFVHNRVRSIDAAAEHLRYLVPEAKIEIGHGQMDADKLEEVMVRFMKHEFNVLVCTTIIETGIDVSSANTMFIDNADDFGLAQLYQLRGRIGRSKERAFAYLLVPAGVDQLSPIARKRLEILHKFSELGAGFRIAQHDLELRGAGDLLGKSQHGHIAAVGYDLYADLLKDAVEELRGRKHEDTVDPDIVLPFAALLPDSYVSDLHERMGIYQRLATAENAEAIWDIVGGMNDLYGETPPEVTALAEVMVLKHLLRPMGILALELVNSDDKQPLPRVVLSLGDRAKLDPVKLANWVKNNPSQLTLTPKMKLIYIPTKEEWIITTERNGIKLTKLAIERLNLL